jgi:hypothetical protein
MGRGTKADPHQGQRSDLFRANRPKTCPLRSGRGFPLRLAAQQRQQNALLSSQCCLCALYCLRRPASRHPPDRASRRRSKVGVYPEPALALRAVIFITVRTGGMMESRCPGREFKSGCGIGGRMSGGRPPSCFGSGEGAVGGFTFGRSRSVVEGVLGALNFSVEETRLTTESGERRGTPKNARRAASPSSKRMTKIRGITKSNCNRDVIIVHRRLAQIPYCKLRSQLA